MMDTRRRDLRRGEPALDRRRGARLRPGLGGAVAARGARGRPTRTSTSVSWSRHVNAKESAMVVTTGCGSTGSASPPGTPRLTPEVIVGDEIVAAEGYVLAVRILEDKSTYNTVEDVTGRMLALRAGDVLAGTLGTRRALRGLRRRGADAHRRRRHGRGPQPRRHPGPLHLGQPRDRPAVPGRGARRHPGVSRARRPDRPAGPHPRSGGAARRLARERGSRWSTSPAPA